MIPVALISLVAGLVAVGGDVSLYDVAAAVVAIFAAYRTGSVKVWRETAEARKERLEEASAETKELHEKLAAVLLENAELKLRPNLEQHATALSRITLVLKQISDGQDLHHKRATERHEALMRMLDQRTRDPHERTRRND